MQLNKVTIKVKNKKKIKNKVTIKNKYPFLRINYSMDWLRGECVLSKVDLGVSYHHIREKFDGAIWRLLLKSVMVIMSMIVSFGVTNVPSVFMDCMRYIFHPYLDSFVMVFIHKIIVYSWTKEEHIEHLRVVCEPWRRSNYLLSC